MSDAGMDCSRLGRRYALAGLLTAVGVLGSLAMLHAAIRNQFAVQFIAPPDKVVRIDAPGEYVLWHNAVVTFETIAYDNPPKLPGARIAVIDVLTLEPVAISNCEETPTGSDVASYALFAFEVDKAGEYAVTVSGLTAPRVFSIRESNRQWISKRMPPALAPGAILAAAGLLLAAWTFVQSRRAPSAARGQQKKDES